MDRNRGGEGRDGAPRRWDECYPWSSEHPHAEHSGMLSRIDQTRLRLDSLLESGGELDKLRRNERVLSQAQLHLGEQMFLLDAMAEKVCEGQCDMVEANKQLEAASRRVETMFDRLFDELKRTPLHDAFNIAGKSLCDFTNSSAVDALREQLRMHYNNALELTTELTSHLTRMRTRHRELRALFEDFRLPDSVKAEIEVLSRAAEQGDQLEKTRLQAVGYADHIGALSKVFRDDGVVNLEEVIVLEERAEELEKDIDITLENVVKFESTLRNGGSDTLSTPILERLGKCLSGLQTFHRQVQHAGQVTRQHFEALENIEMQWEAQTGRAQELIEELEGLESTYVQFSAAHSKVSEEVEQRRVAYSNFRETLQRMESELNQLANVERRRRDEFHTTHGRALPPALVNALTASSPNLVYSISSSREQLADNRGPG